LVLFPYGAEQYAYWRFVSRHPAREAHKPTKIVAGYGWAYVWDAALFCVLVAGGYKSFFVRTPLAAWEWVGHAIYMGGIGLRIWALRTLGPFWDGGVVIHEGHQVVDTGPYRYMRHPLHLGTTLEVAGLACSSPLWLGMPCAVISLVVSVFINRLEERTLLTELGAAYGDYYARTWDLVDLLSPKPRGPAQD
jgi:protein-S-isoprenylcysteine O-methyltransferase Ste14